METLLRPWKGSYPITQPFGPTNYNREPPLLGYTHFHRGVDYGVPCGTPLFASGEGVVSFAGWDTTGYGNTVVVDHGNGLSSRVAHLQDIAVQHGQRVTPATVIGHSGTTGNSTACHVHWETDSYGIPFHPWYVVQDRA